MDQIIAEHLRNISTLKCYSKIRKVAPPIIVRRYQICLFDRLIYRHGRDIIGQGILIDGKQEGLWIVCADGQILSRGSYVNGKRDGLWMFWYPNGQMSSRGYYVDGFLNGIWETWNPDGILISKKKLDLR